MKYFRINTHRGQGLDAEKRYWLKEQEITVSKTAIDGDTGFLVVCPEEKAEELKVTLEAQEWIDNVGETEQNSTDHRSPQ